MNLYNEMYTMRSDLVSRFYSWTLVQKKTVLWGFFTLYYVLGVGFYIGGWSVYGSDSNSLFFRNFGLLCGKLALLVFALTLVPGVMRRFGINHRLMSLLRIFRRYFGILMFMLVLTHAGLISIIPRLPSWPRVAAFGIFEWYGLLAYIILFFMFLTSNDWSVARLKIWWYGLHKMVYGALWFIFIHTALQRVSFWSVFAFTVILVMLVSFIVEYRRNKSLVQP